MKDLRNLASQFPETQEGLSCGKSSFKARNKAFLFVSMDQAAYNLMVKLRDSLPEATTLAARFPARYAVGGHGWVKLTFPHTESPPPGLLEKWVAESYCLLVPKQLVALLPERLRPAGPSPGPAKHRTTPATRRKRTPKRPPLPDSSSP